MSFSYPSYSQPYYKNKLVLDVLNNRVIYVIRNKFAVLLDGDISGSSLKHLLEFFPSGLGLTNTMSARIIRWRL